MIYSSELYSGLMRLRYDGKSLFEVALAGVASVMFIMSLFLPWWKIDSNIGAASAPLWSSQPLPSWVDSAAPIRPNWYLMLPVLIAALVSLLFAGISWKESVALYSLALLIVPWQLLSAQGLLVNYFFSYLSAVSNLSTSNAYGIGYFTGMPGVGIVLYLVAYATLTVLLVYKLLMKDSEPLGRLRIASVLVIFSGFYWYLIGSMAFPSNPAWAWVLGLDTGFILTTGLLLWSARRNGWLSPMDGWRERIQLLFLPALVLMDALTTNYALPVTGPTSSLGSTSTSIHDASLLVDTVQSSGVPQVAYLFWTLLIVQVLALSYLTLGLTSNTKLRSFPRFLASYALHMMIAAYAFTVSNNLLLIFTGRTWFTNSGALVLVIGLAVTLAFVLSISNVWGLRHLGDLEREWSVRF